MPVGGLKGLLWKFGICSFANLLCMGELESEQVLAKTRQSPLF